MSQEFLLPARIDGSYGRMCYEVPVEAKGKDKARPYHTCQQFLAVNAPKRLGFMGIIALEWNRSRAKAQGVPLGSRDCTFLSRVIQQWHSILTEKWFMH